METLQLSLFGRSYDTANRLRRTAVGRLSVPGYERELSHADVYLA